MRASRVFALARTMRLAIVRNGVEKSARNLLGGEAAHLAQRERYLRLRRQGRMTTGENQPQPVVFDILVFMCLRGAGKRSVAVLGEFHKRRIEASAFSKRIDGLEASGGNEPGARSPGTPSRGHCSTAARKASCSASSASSKSPSSRMSVANGQTGFLRMAYRFAVGREFMSGNLGQRPKAAPAYFAKRRTLKAMGSPTTTMWTARPRSTS